MRYQIGRRDFCRAAAMILPTWSMKTFAAQTSAKALVFDTFGTVVDWRGSIIAEGTVWGKARGIDVD